MVRVTNKTNGRQVDVRINDRGPFVGMRVIDLSVQAAREIDLVRPGVAPVKLKVLKSGEYAQLHPFAVQVGAFETESKAEELKKLLEVTEASLYKGIEQARIGNTIGHVGSAIQKHVEANGFSVVREFVGHGIGTKLHEAPQIPNFGKKGQGAELTEGMVLAIEPMVNSGGPEAKVLGDKWTAVTLDGSYSAHFEHCVAVTKQGPMILTQ